MGENTSGIGKNNSSNIYQNTIVGSLCTDLEWSSPHEENLFSRSKRKLGVNGSSKNVKIKPASNAEKSPSADKQFNDSEKSNGKNKNGKKIATSSSSSSSHCESNFLALDIPQGIKPGTRLSVKWPDGRCFLINCPKFVDESGLNNSIVVVAPGGEPPKILSSTKKRSRSNLKRSITSSRIGRGYQAEVSFRSFKNDDITNTSHLTYEPIWDPARANAAIRLGENIDEFVDTKHSDIELRMVALHLCNYSIEEASIMLAKQKESDPDLQPWTNKMKKNYHDTITETYMNMSDVSKKVGKSVNACLRYYYGNYRRTRDYKEFLMKMNDVFENCVVCGKGGELICCDGCNVPYHLKCIKPKLDKIPEGDWYCSHCKYSNRDGK